MSMRYRDNDGKLRILRARDAARLRAEFERTTDVWVYHSADIEWVTYVCELTATGYTAYRANSVDRRTGEVRHDPTGLYVERVSWGRPLNQNHCRAEFEDFLRDGGYVRML